MSNDLISKNALIEEIRKCYISFNNTNMENSDSLISFKSICKIINEQKTAYNVDEVVEQLENAKELVPVNRLLDDIINDKPKELGQLMAYDRAIDIVKGGGVNE